MKVTISVELLLGIVSVLSAVIGYFGRTKARLIFAEQGLKAAHRRIDSLAKWLGLDAFDQSERVYKKEERE